MDARVARVDELPALAETMALAFYADPVWGWAFPDPERRLEQHRAIWGELLEEGIERGSLWTLADGAAAALWVPPGEPELSPEREKRVESMVEEMVGEIRPPAPLTRWRGSTRPTPKRSRITT